MVRKKDLDINEVKAILAALDKNGDGKIDVDELKAFLDSANCKLNKKAVQTFITTHDIDGDGKLNLEELAKVLAC
ncbi:uncharacterized protein DEA37_0011725 [Paragonimus westermani]|uniref:EF-hand domain-containing protein n=1 Tax=Paragonimus westermani TaxID=34504 RepID=A0A5J4N7L6_9TREM|nr:uncharacterized protein DEA37_0011725 [Paragonimus westermani]